MPDFRPVPNASAFVASVLAAAEVQDRRVAREYGPSAPPRPARVVRKSNATWEELQARKAVQLERRAAVLRLREQGRTFKEIADELGISRQTVDGIVARHGVRGEFGIPQRKQERNAGVLALLQRGVPASRVGRRLNVNYRVVCRIAAEAGLRLVVGRPVKAAEPKLKRSSSRVSAMERFGLSAEEFQDYGVIRAKGYTAEEAADIIIRSRRPAPQADQESPSQRLAHGQ